MKFNYLFKILSAFLVISGLYSCSVDEEDTNEEFSFTIDGTNYSTKDYYLTNSTDGLYLVGRFGSDSLVFNLQATQDLPIIIGEYEFTGNSFYAAIHATDTSMAIGQIGSIDFESVSKRINADFNFMATPILGSSYLIENGKLRNLLVTQLLNNPDIDVTDPNAPFNIAYITDLQDGVSANINVFPFISPLTTTSGTMEENKIMVSGEDLIGNKIEITLNDISNTFVGKTYNAVDDIDLAFSNASIYYENVDSQFKSITGKVYVKSIDEDNRATIAFKCLLQDVNDPTNLFIVDEGAVKNVQLN